MLMGGAARRIRGYGGSTWNTSRINSKFAKNCQLRRPDQGVSTDRQKARQLDLQIIAEMEHTPLGPQQARHGLYDWLTHLHCPRCHEIDGFEIYQRRKLFDSSGNDAYARNSDSLDSLAQKRSFLADG